MTKVVHLSLFTQPTSNARVTAMLLLCLQPWQQLWLVSACTWAARYNTWLLMPKGIVFSSLFLSWFLRPSTLYAPVLLDVGHVRSLHCLRHGRWSWTWHNAVQQPVAQFCSFHTNCRCLCRLLHPASACLCVQHWVPPHTESYLGQHTPDFWGNGTQYWVPEMTSCLDDEMPQETIAEGDICRLIIQDTGSFVTDYIQDLLGHQHSCK